MLSRTEILDRIYAGFIGKAVGPKAGGVPYTKER